MWEIKINVHELRNPLKHNFNLQFQPFSNNQRGIPQTNNRRIDQNMRLG